MLICKGERLAVYDIGDGTMEWQTYAECSLHFRDYGTRQTRDTGNRAIDLILNNLKGIFFPDDNIEHMAFAIVGSWTEAPLTQIVIGDLDKNPGYVLDEITNAFG